MGRASATQHHCFIMPMLMYLSIGAVTASVWPPSGRNWLTRLLQTPASEDGSWLPRSMRMHIGHLATATASRASPPSSSLVGGNPQPLLQSKKVSGGKGGAASV